MFDDKIICDALSSVDKKKEEDFCLENPNGWNVLEHCFSEGWLRNVSMEGQKSFINEIEVPTIDNHYELTDKGREKLAELLSK